MRLLHVSRSEDYKRSLRSTELGRQGDHALWQGVMKPHCTWLVREGETQQNLVGDSVYMLV